MLHSPVLCTSKGTLRGRQVTFAEKAREVEEGQNDRDAAHVVRQHTGQKFSATGNRTRACWVRASYPNH